jgi:OOP family OmpA-OmpF porin
MRSVSITSTSLMLLLMLSACTKLETLQHAKQQGTPFQQQLSTKYLSFAEAEAAKYDWIDSQHFINKGMQAAMGQEVTPEPVEQWRIPEVMLSQMHEARGMLIAKLDQPQIKDHFPEVIARAQTKYDCWLEEQEENWQLEDIAACREGFYNALAELGGKQDPVVAQPSHGSYQLYFANDSSALDSKAMALAAQIAADLAEQENYHININGYTDLVGADDYNLRLSMRRAVSVKEALVAHGLNDKHIEVFAFGKSDAAVPTPDNVAEPKNRRVFVYLKD